jgi:hypothetical protein
MSSPRIGTTVRLPRQRGRRSSQPFIVVVDERPSLTRQALTGLGSVAWTHRGALAPIPVALLALGLTWLLHTVAWWSGLLLAPVAVAPLVWLWIVQRSHPAAGSALAWRIALAVASTLAAGWVAAAATFGPLAGPLELLWLLALIGTQTAWPIVRRTR